MATNFPNNPSINDTFTANDKTWKWDGNVWRSIGVPIGGVSGSMEFIGEAEIIGAAATTLVMSGIDLNADGRYFIEIELVGASGAPTIAMTYNDDTTATNYDVQVSEVAGGSAGQARANNAILLTTVTTDTTSIEGWLRINGEGNPRFIYRYSSGDTTAIKTGYGVHTWRTPATNITSLTLTSSVSSALGIGSRIRVWKMTEVSSVAPTSSAFNAATSFEYYTDFIGHDSTDDLGWAFNSNAGGAVSRSSESKHPGTNICTTNTNNAAYAISSLSQIGGSVFTASPMFFLPTGSDELNLEMCFKVNTLFTAENPGAYRLGFIDQVTNYLQLCYLDLSQLAQNFSLKGANGNIGIAISSPVVANTWYRVKFTLTATRCECFLDDVSVASSTDTTKFPTAGFTVFQFAQNQGLTGVNHIITVDYVRAWGTVTRD